MTDTNTKDKGIASIVLTFHMQAKHKKAVLDALNKKGKVVLCPLKISLAEYAWNLDDNDNLIITKLEPTNSNTNVNENEQETPVTGKTDEEESDNLNAVAEIEHRDDAECNTQVEVMAAKKTVVNSIVNSIIANNVNKYACKTCNLSYSQFSAYKRHIMNKHSNKQTELQQPINNTIQKRIFERVTCSNCNNEFSSKYTLQKHTNGRCKGQSLQASFVNHLNNTPIPILNALTELIKAANGQT